ncbi:histone H2B [Striga asiatica]|uniref:Histone H2B n=1 Tax=Striga asiatica TaxID=4170 RepID=A0A5A7Q2T9_STRAF|nr:histone H2B [Striga asiatica]
MVGGLAQSGCSVLTMLDYNWATSSSKPRVADDSPAEATPIKNTHGNYASSFTHGKKRTVPSRGIQNALRLVLRGDLCFCNVLGGPQTNNTRRTNTSSNARSPSSVGLEIQEAHNQQLQQDVAQIRRMVNSSMRV